MSEVEKKKLILNIFPTNATVKYEGDAGKPNPSWIIDAYGEIPNVSWRTKENNFFYGKNAKDIFYFAMCYGKYHNDPVPITKKHGDIRLDAFTNSELWQMLSIGMAELAKENSEASTDFIDPKNANKILNTCMEYANGGIRGLKRLMENSSSNYFEGFENELDEVLEYYDKINADQ